MPGKVLFSTSAGIKSVCELKAAERVFLLLKQESPLRVSVYTKTGTSLTRKHIHKTTRLSIVQKYIKYLV